MEKIEWFCPVCGKLNYGYICEYIGKECKLCKTKVYIKGDKAVASYNR